MEQIDWPCEVQTDYSTTNLGVKRRVESGLDWVFSRFEAAIILEDDCIAEPTFFGFCDELLARYRTDSDVLSISGNNFQSGQRRGEASYYFSRYSHIWGWATWRRAWSLHDPAMSLWPEARAARWLESIFGSGPISQYWSYIFETNYSSQDSWAYAWIFSCWRQGGVHLLPNQNLVSNHGFGPSASHTTDPNSRFANMPTMPMAFPLLHPNSKAANHVADAFTEEVMFSGTLKQMLTRARRAAHGRQRSEQP